MFTHRAISSSRSKKYLTMFVIALAFSAIIHVGYAISEPTPEEIIQSQIEFNGAEWDRLNELEQSALKDIEQLREAKNALHVQTESLRAFFSGRNTQN